MNPWFSVGTDRVRLLRDGVEAFPAMLEAIQRARREILLEMYWIGSDLVGERFRDALVARARDGVEVRVIYDSVGSLDLTPDWWSPLRDVGGQIHEFRALSPFTVGFRMERVERRDHRKILVVDGFTGFTGGINLAVVWLPVDQGGKGWQDHMVEVEGAIVGELRTLFYKHWHKLWRSPIPSDVAPLARRHRSPVWVLASQWTRFRSIHHEYVRRIKRAESRIDIANSYFIPGRAVRKALFWACSRGVEVRVLVPSVSDVPLVQFASEALYDTLLSHGVRIYALVGGMLHAKTAVIDDSFTTIGSFNLDHRSWVKNLEVNLAVENRAFARHVRSSFESDLARAVPVELSVWRQRSPMRRAAEWAALALRKFL